MGSKNLLGPKSQVWLRALGVESSEDLAEWDVVDLALELKAMGYPVSFHLVVGLWAVQNACSLADLEGSLKEQKEDLRKRWLEGVGLQNKKSRA